MRASNTTKPFNNLCMLMLCYLDRQIDSMSHSWTLYVKIFSQFGFSNIYGTTFCIYIRKLSKSLRFSICLELTHFTISSLRVTNIFTFPVSFHQSWMQMLNILTLESSMRSKISNGSNYRITNLKRNQRDEDSSGYISYEKHTTNKD